MVNETLSFYTPYADIGRMRKALQTVLHDDITAFRDDTRSFHLRIKANEYIDIPYVSVQMNQNIFQSQIQRLYSSSAKLPCDNPYVKQNLIYQIALFRAAYVLTFNYEADKRDEKIIPLMEIADEMDALIFWETGDISDSYGDIIINKKGVSEVSVFNPVDGFDITNRSLGLNEEAMKRIHRSMTILRYKGIYAPTNIAPPYASSMFLYQSDEEIAKRAVACTLIGVYSSLLMSSNGNVKASYKETEKMIKTFKATPFFTFKEIEYLNDPQPISEIVHSHLSYYESAYTLLWALGIFDNLYFPDSYSNGNLIVKTVMQFRTVDKMMHKSKLRAKNELLDALDLIQRYAWAVQDARHLSFQMPAGMISEVVLERYKTLSWMISEKEMSWDEVSPIMRSLKLRR